MKRSDHLRLTAPLVALALAAGVTACGDDENGDDPSPTAIEISIPTGTTETTSTKAEDDPTATQSTAEISDKQRKQAEKIEEGLEKEGVETVPDIGVIPKPTASERKQIRRCVERAEGDPQKLAKCGEIVSR